MRESPIVGIFHPRASGEAMTVLGPMSLKPGTIVSCTLDAAINSEHQTIVVATVRSPVYDSLTGTRELIPVESTLTGRTRGLLLGEETVDITWETLTVGKRVYELGGMPGGDLSGQAGLAGDVDHKWLTRLSATLVRSVTVASTGMFYGAGSGDASTLAGAQAASSAVQQTGEQLTRTMSVNPTSYVAPGTPCSLTVTKLFDLGAVPMRKGS
jgi:type IV secretion system protein VirB10